MYSKKEHTIKNCFCKTEPENEEEKDVMAEMEKDNRREERLNGYKEIEINEIPF